MDEEGLEFLRSIGYTDEILKYLEWTPEHEAVNQMFRRNAERALSEAGVTALEWLAANPKISHIDLARELNRGANGFGLNLAIYHEADLQGVFRDVAKEMLIRTILDKYPDGWTSTGDLTPCSKIGGWDSGIMDYARDTAFYKYAELINVDLAIKNQPPEGWIPQWPTDPLIDDLFDRFWPK